MFNVSLHAELDSGCSLFALMSPTFAEKHKIPRIPLQHPVNAITADGKPLGPDLIRYRTPSYKVHINGHSWEPSLWFMIAPIGDRDAIIGYPWLLKHDPDVR